MVVVSSLEVLVVVVVVTKVLLRATAIIDMVVTVELLLVDSLTEVDIIAVGGIVTVLKFALLVVPYSVDVSSGVPIGVFMDTLAGVMPGVLTGIGVEVLPDVNANAFAVAMTALDFPVSSPLDPFSPASA